jgi:hypothetical protein
MNQTSMRAIAVLISFLLACPMCAADEGMWLLDSIHQLPIEELKARGLELDPREIYSADGGGIAQAVVRVDGGTGSFVSPQGLILTNHHVAFTAVQRQSTPENNYLRDGFYAPVREDELPAIGYDAYVLQSFRDVTGRVLGAVTERLSDLERYRAIDSVTKAIIGEAETGQDIRCKLASMYGGGQYYLFTYLKIRDVRLVFAPPRSIGDFGGEIDNWMWPRHSGDFAFLRAYVGPNGRPADYSEKNVPYNPEVHLKLSSRGVKEGDFVMLVGFPGKTKRYESSFSIDQMVNHDYPLDIGTRQELIAILEAASAEDSSVALRLSSQIKGVNNYLKKNQGMLEGFDRAQILQHKIAEERSLQVGFNRYPRLSKFRHVLPGLDSLFKERSRLQGKDFLMGRMIYRSKFLNFASTIYKWAAEREKADHQREPGYQDRDSSETRERLEDAQVNLVPSVDRQVLLYFLKKALKLPPNQRIRAIDRVVEGSADQDKSDILREFVDGLYQRTKLGSTGDRLSMLGMSKEELEELGDPFIEFAARLEVEREKLREREKEFSGALTRLEPKLIQAFSEYRGTMLYPDANGTMRFNYGEVEGYSPRDAVEFGHVTTLTGVFEKQTDQEPFLVPPELEKVFSERDLGPYVDASLLDVPVNFLSTNDVTNGNSGSPIMNGQGELVGLVFDGNYESITSDYLFEPEITRTINVDIRYVLFLLDRVYHAENLLGELTIR